MRNTPPSITLPFGQGVLNPLVTCVRTGTATIINKKGLIEDVAANTPRITYDMDGVCKGLLSEPTSQNIIPYADYPYTSTRAWSLQGTPTISVIDSIYGASSGVNIVWSNTQGIFKNFSGLAASTPHTFTCYARGSGTFAMAEGFAPTQQTKTLTDKWQRFTLTANSTAGGQFQCFFVRAGTSATSIQICGVQLEALPFATSLIKTAGAAVTRQIDKNNYSLTNWYSLRGTWLVEYELLDVSHLGVHCLLSIGRSSFVSGESFFQANIERGSGTNAYNTKYCNDTLSGSNVSLSLQAVNTIYKYAASYCSIQNDVTPEQKIYHNGTLVATSVKNDVSQTSAAVQCTPDTVLSLGHSVNGETGSNIAPLYGIIKKIVFYPSILTDAEVATL